MEFSITRLVGTKRNDNFYFLSLSAFSNLFWLEKKPWQSFLIFLKFLYFFGIFCYSLGGNETERQFLFSLFLGLFQPILPWNVATMVFFDFLIFVLFFWNFLLRVGWERNGTSIFIFSISRPFPTYFGLKWSHNSIFWFFDFSSLFLEFSITRWVETKRNDNFYFLSLSAFSNLFWLEKKA